jgi:multimeric flavodoxin WrbA
MNVLAINGSPRHDGNTAFLLNAVLEPIKAADIETDFFQLGGNLVHGCTACMKCRTLQNSKCVIDSDVINSCIAKMVEADAIILGSPTYFTDVTTEMKALIDRAGFVNGANGGLFRRKVGAAVLAVRRAGSLHAFDTINHLFLIAEMIVPGSTYWNLGVGREKGQVANDPEGLNNMKNLGENIAWLLQKLHSSS